MSTILRLVRPTSDSPGIFARPGHNDHRLLCQLISEGRAGISGVIFDPAFLEEQQELLGASNRRNLWSVLDPRALELSTAGGFTARRRTLPWAAQRPHVPGDFEGTRGREFVQQIVQFAIDNKYSAVLAPSHYLARGFSDPWFRVDLGLLDLLREELDKNAAADTAIYYPLRIPTDILFEEAQRIAFKLAFKGTAKIDAFWLGVHPFGGHSGHVTLEHYIRSTRDMQETGIPIVGEKVGALGTGLLAFGALGGLEIGVSSGESFDYKRLLKKMAAAKGFAPHRGVILEALGITLEAKAAKLFFDNRTHRAQFGCRDTSCCRQGYTDTLKDPRRHYVLSRLAEFSALSGAPYQERPTLFLERFLRPATDKLGRVAQSDIPATIRRKVEREQRKKSGWRNTLGLLSQVPLSTAAKVPAKRVERLKGAA